MLPPGILSDNAIFYCNDEVDSVASFCSLKWIIL